MDWEKAASLLRPRLKGECRLNEPLKKHTTWRIGGPADLLIFPKCKEDIIAVLQFSNEQQLPLYILGNGSNVLVLDKGVRGIVLKTCGLNSLNVNGEIIKAGAGVLLPHLAKVALEHSLSGLEFIAGIPGTVGGAVTMNAGAYGSTIGNVLQSIQVTDLTGKVFTLNREEANFTYRSSSIKDLGYIVLEAEFILKHGNKEQISHVMQLNMESRKKKQPLNLPNAGSTFVNPPGYAAGYLIEQVGAKGLKKGGAQVSEKHANFIVNYDHASAKDVLELIAQVKDRVYQRYGIHLQTEIKVLGEG
ncbi:UDP-N-acetylmuramate dehydrogenase [Bacillota bacterium LX-D]|nr:UDP-N-acetylmuramate dehydrogenase [Bacillota bacterium LX-D]